MCGGNVDPPSTPSRPASGVKRDASRVKSDASGVKAQQDLPSCCQRSPYCRKPGASRASPRAFVHRSKAQPDISQSLRQVCAHCHWHCTCPRESGSQRLPSISGTRDEAHLPQPEYRLCTWPPGSIATPSSLVGTAPGSVATPPMDCADFAIVGAHARTRRTTPKRWEVGGRGIPSAVDPQLFRCHSLGSEAAASSGWRARCASAGRRQSCRSRPFRPASVLARAHIPTFILIPNPIPHLINFLATHLTLSAESPFCCR